MVLALAMGPGSAEAQATLDDVVAWLDPLVLQETEAALNARPTLIVDPGHGFLVADAQENQVRVYGPEGGLRLFFGREGDGPGEFRALRGAARLQAGGFAAVGYEGRLSLWNGVGELVDDFRLPIRSLIGVADGGDGHVLVVTEPTVAGFDDLDGPMLHRVSTADGSVAERWMSLPLTASNAVAALMVTGDVAPPVADRLGVTWTVFDSLWTVDLSSRSVTSTVRLESEALARNAPPVDRRRDPRGFATWVRETTFPISAHFLPGGGWLVVLVRNAESGQVIGLLRVDDAGRRMWEIEPAARLVAVDPVSGVLYFEEPSGLEPGTFLRARLR